VEERKAQLLQQQSRLTEDKINSPRQVAIRQATVNSRQASADSAKAQLDAALLNLSYCHIVSPVDGIASQRSAEIGSRISQGQQLIVIVQTAGVWTTANFKETQLRKMHVGQRVNIKVDSLDESFEGEVEYMPAATGDRSSLFPPENATGNYVKIVQRLPVRIQFNPNQRDLDRLRPGMSVEAKVHLD
jgi:membrane fusion protein (multidrug efflux system)